MSAIKLDYGLKMTLQRKDVAELRFLLHLILGIHVFVLHLNLLNIFVQLRSTVLYPCAKSLEISHVLLKKALQLKQGYRGHFSSFFEQPEVARFLNIKDDEQLLAIENTFGSCADVFYEAVPWPVHPDHHLVPRTSKNVISFDRNYPKTKIDELSDAIEFASWGPWIGIKFEDLFNIISPQAPKKNSAGTGFTISGKRIMMPFFSHGLQGLVVGFFVGVDDAALETIRTELLQFGVTLADKWSILRSTRFWASVREYRGDISRLAASLIYMISPVDYAIIEVDGRMAGYKLCTESGYWAGYKKLSSEDALSLKQNESEIVLRNVLFPNSLVIIKTLPDSANIDSFFTRTRLEMILRNPLGVNYTSKQKELTFDDVVDKIRSLQEKVEAGHKSLSTLRQLYVLEKVAKHFSEGNATITNSELREYFTKELGEGAKGGYQISSHSGEIERLFEAGLAVERSRIGLNLSWSTS